MRATILRVEYGLWPACLTAAAALIEGDLASRTTLLQAARSSRICDAFEKTRQVGRPASGRGVT
jgi:hypothetical protein